MSGLRVGGVLLAAGRGERYGTQSKLLAEIAGEPLVRHAARALSEAGLAPIVVVTGQAGDAIAAALDGLGLERSDVSARPLALGRSLACGVTALLGRVDAAVIALGDMPWIRAAHVRAICAAYDPAAGDVACVPCVGARRGHPVLLGAALFEELALLDGDEGARAVLERYAARVRSVALDDPAILRDVDRAEDLV